MTTTYITLQEAKDQLGIDAGLTIDDAKISAMIGASIDWAENYTSRSLGELLELDSGIDSTTTPQPDPVDSPTPGAWRSRVGQEEYGGGFDWTLESIVWTPDQWRHYWAKNPIQQDHSHALRRDVKAAILIYLETLYDRNPENFALLERRATDMLWPYRIALGV